MPASAHDCERVHMCIRVLLFSVSFSDDCLPPGGVVGEGRSRAAGPGRKKGREAERKDRINSDQEVKYYFD